MPNLLTPSLLDSLRRIVEDAAQATEKDDRAIEAERPLFGRLLDASIPIWRKPATRSRYGVAADI